MRIRTYMEPRTTLSNIAAATSVLDEVDGRKMAGASTRKPKVIFVLGGPGSGKGTQCQMIVENFKFVHLSVGDLLRAEVSSGSKIGVGIQQTVKEGKLVSSEIVVNLILNAMKKSSVNHFLIDGFPRIDENRIVFERLIGITPEFVLFFECAEAELQKRLLQRARYDDNVETIKKRVQVFLEETIPVVDYYEDLGKLRRVNAARPIERIFNTVKALFLPYIQDELLELSEELLNGIDAGDYATYEKLCDSELTAFEPESQGQLVEKLPFHKFYFDIRGSGTVQRRFSTIAAPKVTVLSDDVVLVTYTRLAQDRGIPLAGHTDAYNETRLWKRNRLGVGKWEWKHVHFHRSVAPTTDARVSVYKL